MFRWILYISAPVALAKAAISAIHLVTAARNIGNIDAVEREEARQLKAN